jgi:hypothetical protein
MKFDMWADGGIYPRKRVGKLLLLSPQLQNVLAGRIFEVMCDRHF